MIGVDLEVPRSYPDDEPREQHSVNRRRMESTNRRKSHKKRHKKQHDEKAHKLAYDEAIQSARNTVIIVSVLIATVAFTAGMSPPGGVYQDGPHIGKAVLAKTTEFKVFMISNMLALFVSLGIVIVLVSVIPFRRKALMRVLKYSHRAMWVAVFFMATAFVAAVWGTLPSDRSYEKDGVGWVKAVLLVVAGGSLGAVFCGWMFMLGAHLKRRSRWRRSKVPKTDDVKNNNDDDDDNVEDFGIPSMESRLSVASSNSDYDSSNEIGYHPV